jgi:hypothetical protein
MGRLSWNDSSSSVREKKTERFSKSLTSAVASLLCVFTSNYSRNIVIATALDGDGDDDDNVMEDECD